MLIISFTFARSTSMSASVGGSLEKGVSSVDTALLFAEEFAAAVASVETMPSASLLALDPLRSDGDAEGKMPVGPSHPSCAAACSPSPPPLCCGIADEMGKSEIIWLGMNTEAKPRNSKRVSKKSPNVGTQPSWLCSIAAATFRHPLRIRKNLSPDAPSRRPRRMNASAS